MIIASQDPHTFMHVLLLIHTKVSAIFCCPGGHDDVCISLTLRVHELWWGGINSESRFEDMPCLE